MVGWVSFFNPTYHAKFIRINMLESKNSDREINKQTVIESLKTVSGYLEDLATGRIYKENDEVVQSIQKWGIENSLVIYYSLRLRVVPESTDKSRRPSNTALATTNKILRKIGYDPIRIQERDGERRIGFYRVKNANDKHVLNIYEFLITKFEKSIATNAKRRKYYNQESRRVRGKVPKIPKVSKDKPQDVYIIQCPETLRIKIGISNNPHRRLAQIQTNYPCPLSIVRIITTENARRLEASLHELLDEFRLQGEWFDAMAINEIPLEVDNL
jgi:Meiotically up-regulated gene 113